MVEPKLTRAQVQRLLGALRDGNTLAVARAAAGVGVFDLDDWLAAGGQTLVERARAHAEARYVARVKSEAECNWQAAAWMLERGFPERWARLSQRAKAEPEVEPAAATDPFEEVDQLAEQRRRRLG